MPKKRCNINLQEQIYEELREEAHRARRSMSQVTEAAVRLYLDSTDEDREPYLTATDPEK